MDTATEKSELTLAAIVNAALEMAAKEGLSSLSLGEVARQLGISKSGVFSRVGSLEALQQAVLEEFNRGYQEQVFNPAMALPRGLPRLNALVEGWITRLTNTTGCIYIAGAFEYDDIASPMRDHLQNNILRVRAMLRRTIVQALEIGHLRPDTDPDQLSFEIYSLIIGMMHDARFLRDPLAEARTRNAYHRLASTYRNFNYHD